jgi:MFS family permease
MKFNKAIIIAFTALLLDVIATGLFTALIMHLLLIEESPDNINRTAENVLFGSGYLVILSPAYLLAAPILGYCSDIFGRKRILIFSMVCDTCGYSLVLAGICFNSIILILFGLALLGIGNSNLSLSLAIIADASIRKKKAFAFGIIAIAMNTLVIIMHFGNQVLAHFAYSTACYKWLLAGIIALEFVNLSLLTTQLAETNININQRAHFSINHAFKAAGVLLSKKSLRILLLLFLLIEFAAGLYNQYIFVYLTAILNNTIHSAASFIDYRTCIMLLSLAVLYPPLVYRISLRYLLIGCICLACFGLFIASLLPITIVQWICGLIIASNFALLEPILWTLLSNCASRFHQGLILGLFGPTWMLAWMLSGIISDVAININTIPLWLATYALLSGIAIIYLKMIKQPVTAINRCIT